MCRKNTSELTLLINTSESLACVSIDITLASIDHLLQKDWHRSYLSTKRSYMLLTIFIDGTHTLRGPERTRLTEMGYNVIPKESHTSAIPTLLLTRTRQSFTAVRHSVIDVITEKNPYISI